jgi:cobalt/nickel transport system permease protein
MIIEQFSAGNSPLHRMDPRVKICLALPYAFVIALSERLPVLLAALGLGIMLSAAARLKITALLGNLRMFFLFILMLWIVLPLTVRGSTHYQLGPLTLYIAGIQHALSISIKSLSIVLIIVALLGTSTVFSLVHGLSHFRVPKKLVHLTFLSYRYIHVLRSEYLRLRDAMRIRGFRPKTNLHTYRSYGYLIGMLLIRSYERSERVYRAMLCRGFQGRFYLLDHFHVHTRDLLLAAGMFALLVGIGICEWTTLLL